MKLHQVSSTSVLTRWEWNKMYLVTKNVHWQGVNVRDVYIRTDTFPHICPSGDYKYVFEGFFRKEFLLTASTFVTCTSALRENFGKWVAAFINLFNWFFYFSKQQRQLKFLVFLKLISFKFATYKLLKNYDYFDNRSYHFTNNLPSILQSIKNSKTLENSGLKSFRLKNGNILK